MVIVLNPKTRTATIYRGFDDIRILTEGDTIDGGDVMPGWQLPLAVMSMLPRRVLTTYTQARARLASLCKDVTDDSDYVC